MFNATNVKARQYMLALFISCNIGEAYTCFVHVTQLAVGTHSPKRYLQSLITRKSIAVYTHSLSTQTRTSVSTSHNSSVVQFHTHLIAVNLSLHLLAA